MGTVAVNPPKTPVTKGSNGIAAATVPNVCKMPAPPAPFVPTPLPNIGRSSVSPKGYSKSVTMDGDKVAIRGASFGSQGDIASKGTGGGLISSNTHGPTKFVGPGAMDVKIEGKNVHLLGDPMLNNCGPSGSPANSATLAGLAQPPQLTPECCSDPKIVRNPPAGYETRSPQELVQHLENEANDLEKKGLSALADAGRDEARIKSAKSMLSGAADKRFEAQVARDTNAKEVNVKFTCAACGKLFGEFDVITAKGTVKEAKNSASQIDVDQFHKERALAAVFEPPGTIVHWAIPRGTRKVALKRFVRPSGRRMTNKGAGYNGVIQEH